LGAAVVVDGRGYSWVMNSFAQMFTENTSVTDAIESVREEHAAMLRSLFGEPISLAAAVTAPSLEITLAPVAEEMPVAVIVPQNLELVVGSLTYLHNGIQKSLLVPPQNIDGSIVVPLLFVAEAFGADVSWDGDTETAVILLDGKEINVTVGVMAPGMNTPAINQDGTILVPLRYVGEAFDSELDYDGPTETIFITR
jgi:hypothetical protein